MKWFKGSALIVGLIAMMSSAFSAEEILKFDSEDLRERYSELIFQLRCPKCQNQNVADSNAPISVDIRQKTYEMLHQGYSNQEIIDYMVDRYTEFVIYKPQFSLVTIWLWLVPFSLLALGIGILLKMTRRKPTSEDESLSADESERLKSLLGDKS